MEQEFTLSQEHRTPTPLEAAQAQIYQLSQQLATERDAARQTQAHLQDQLKQQEHYIAELKAQTEELHWILSSSPAITYRCQVEVNYDCTFVTSNIESVLGYTPAEVFAEPEFWQKRIHPEDAERALADIFLRFKRGHLTSEYRFRHRDGHYVWLRDESIVIYDDQGNPSEGVGYITDITIRKHAEQRVDQELQRIAAENRQYRQTLKEQEATYRHLFDCNPQPMWVYDLETLHFLAVNDAAVAKYGYSRAEFMAMTIADIRPPEDVPRLLENVAQVDTGIDFAGIWQHRLRNGQIIQVEIVSHALEFEGRRAELVMALDVTQRVEAEQALHHLNRALEQTVAERTAELRKSQTELQTILNSSPAKIYVEDLDGRYTFVNQTFLNILHCQPEDILGKTPYELFPADIADAFRANERLLQEHGGVQQFEETVLVNGEERVYWSSKFLLKDDQGEVYALCGMSTDITDRKAVESALQVSRDRIQATLAALPDIVLRLDQSGRYLDFHASNFMQEMTGVEDLVGRAMAEVLPAEMAQDRLQRIQRVVHSQTVEVYEQQIQLNGEQRHEEVRIAPCGDNEAVFVIRDITDRKQAEAQLKRQLAAIEAAVDGIGILQDETFQYVNRAHLEILGYSQAEELVGQSWKLLYGPEELARFEQEIMPRLARDRAWVGEAVATRKDGTTFDQGISLTLTEEGLLICVCEDISDRKAAERALHTSQTFLQTVLETAPLAIFWKDLQGVYQGANTQTAEIFGLKTTADIIHRTDAQLAWPPDLVDIIQAEDQQIIATGKAYLNIVQQTTLNTGREIWIEVKKVPLRNEAGQIVGILGTAQDITTRKQAEIELQDLTTRLTLALKVGAYGTWDWDFVHEATWDERMYEIYGLQQLGRAATYQDWRDCVHPDDIDHVEAQLQATVRGEATFNVEFRIWRRDGHLRWVQAMAQIQQDSQGMSQRMVGLNLDITERKETEEQLRNLSHRLSLAVQAGQIGIWSWDLDQQLLWDEQLCKIYGLQHPESIMSWQAWRSMVHHEDIERVEARLRATLAGAPYAGVEFRIWRTDGELRWLQSFAQVQRDDQGNPVQMVGINQDITERKLAEQTLEASENRFRRVFASNVVGIMFTDFSGLVLDANERFLNLLGYTQTELKARMINWVNLTPPEHRGQDLEAMEMLRRHGTVDPWEKEYIRKDGSRIAVLVGVAMLHETDTQCVCVVIDISDRKQAELDLQRTNAELERATRLKDEFLANMSHELRTPLNAVLGMAEGLQEEVFGPLTERQRRSLNTIERSGTHLLSLINDILDLSKIEAGHLELDFAPITISLLIDSSLTFVKQQAHKKQLRLETQIPAGLPDLWGDERRLRQVLINLLTNAVKFTPEGGRITISAAYTPRTPDDRANYRELIHPQGDPATTVGILSLAVADTGIGISPKNAKKLFQPFVQVDSSLNRQHEGTGLGLALVKRITELHGGQVELTSEVGSGSCFTIQLPIMAIASNNAAAANLTASIDAPTTTTSDAAPLILLAEDNAANINTTTAYLTAKGYYLMVAKNGIEAVNLAQTNHPDLILMDIQMPQLDGLEAIRRIRQIPALANVPILAVTALAMEGDRDRCLAAGANEYICKPIRLKQLSHLIHTLLPKSSIE